MLVDQNEWMIKTKKWHFCGRRGQAKFGRAGLSTVYTSTNSTYVVSTNSAATAAELHYDNLHEKQFV